MATVNTGIKSVRDANVACQIAHHLVQVLQRQSVVLTKERQHSVCITGDGSLLLLVANLNQAVLLTLPAEQLGRVLQIAQQCCSKTTEPESARTPTPSQPPVEPYAAQLARQCGESDATRASCRTGSEQTPREPTDRSANVEQPHRRSPTRHRNRERTESCFVHPQSTSQSGRADADQRSEPGHSGTRNLCLDGSWWRRRESTLLGILGGAESPDCCRKESCSSLGGPRRPAIIQWCLDGGWNTQEGTLIEYVALAN